jgi:UDP-N-acetylglucosamine/UDP-N-acetylgalactosamine diphosphorylase
MEQAARNGNPQEVTMVSFPGFEDTIQAVYDNGHGHVFAFWNELDDSGKKELLSDLSSVDFTLLARLFAGMKQPHAASLEYEPSDYIPLPSTAKERDEHERARERGIEVIKSGAAAAFLVAGGQGTRLGFDGPKGAFGVGPVSGKSLFQIHAEKILKYSLKYGVSIPWMIMTSPANHSDTLYFLEKNRFFGLDPLDVILFPQSMIPSLDGAGRLILEEKCRIFKNPDGHGGSLTALADSGALAEMERRGIRIISYFQVDNPLVRIIDPEFIGFHDLRGADISSKGLMKAYPGEKIGVFVRFSDATTGVVEYSDLPEILQNQRGADGALRFCMGSIAIHLFGIPFVRKITGNASLAYHVARKKIQSLGANGREEIEGFKFEKFVFDALPLTGRNIVMETLREDEFAPVKNRSGVDSVETAQDLMMAQHRRWLSARGIDIPAAVRALEISPLVAVEPSDIPAGCTVPAAEKAYIG